MERFGQMNGLGQMGIDGDGWEQMGIDEWIGIDGIDGEIDEQIEIDGIDGNQMNRLRLMEGQMNGFGQMNRWEQMNRLE